MGEYNLMDTEWTWDEVERWWKSQSIINYMWDYSRDCFIFLKSDGSFYMDVIEHDFYIVKMDRTLPAMFPKPIS
jgi:hypothetical protein